MMDFDGLSMKQVMGFSPSFSMKLLSFIQDAMPLRLKEVRNIVVSSIRGYLGLLRRVAMQLRNP